MKMGNISSVTPGLISDVIQVLDAVSNVKTAKETLIEIKKELEIYYKEVESSSIIAAAASSDLAEIVSQRNSLNQEKEKLKNEKSEHAKNLELLKEEKIILEKEKKALELEDARIKAVIAQAQRDSNIIEVAAAEATKRALAKEEAAEALAKEYTAKLEKLKSIMGDK